MPRKKGPGKHATGKRKTKGAHLEQVLRREARDQPTAPALAAAAAASGAAAAPAPACFALRKMDPS